MFDTQVNKAISDDAPAVYFNSELSVVWVRRVNTETACELHNILSFTHRSYTPETAYLRSLHGYTPFYQVVYVPKNKGGKRMEKVLYSVKEVSQILHTNPSYVYQLINTGLLPVLKLGSYKVRHEALMKFLSEYESYDLSDPKNVEKITATA